MLRPVLFALAVIALVVPAPAAAPDLAGKWMLSTASAPGAESTVCILKFESKDGKPSASVVFSPENVETTVTDFRSTGAGVAVTVKQVRTLKDEKTKKEIKSSSELAFVGVRGKDPKVILGSTGNERFRTRAKLTATDKETLGKEELVVRAPLPEPMTKIQQLTSRASAAQTKLFREKDAEKRKDLQKEYTEAFREMTEKQPALYREVVEKHADSQVAFDAALFLLRGAARNKLTADDASKMVRVVQELGTPYGPLFVGVSLAPIAETLAGRSGLEAVAVAAIEPAAKAMIDDHPAAIRSLVLSAYQAALAKAGKTAEAKEVGARVAKLEAAIDAEYLKSVPPFKAAAFAGRKDKSANQVAVMELFTGAQCPPCVAADVAFDALQKAYKPTDLVLIQYHLHIPGPDALTNADTVTRAKYYAINSTPSTFFNGEKAASGGGGMAAAENKFEQYTAVINPLLEKTAAVKIAGRAKRFGDKIDIAVEVNGGDGDELKLRLLVVEENVKYVGSNALRFHHQVVRAMPGGAEGVAVKDKAFKHTTAVDLAEVRKGMTKYLDDFVVANPTRPFAKPDRPMEMKAVKVIALVQNDKTKEIVQAAQVEIEGNPTAVPAID